MKTNQNKKNPIKYSPTQEKNRATSEKQLNLYFTLSYANIQTYCTCTQKLFNTTEKRSGKYWKIIKQEHAMILQLKNNRSQSRSYVPKVYDREQQRTQNLLNNIELLPNNFTADLSINASLTRRDKYFASRLLLSRRKKLHGNFKSCQVVFQGGEHWKRYRDTNSLVITRKLRPWRRHLSTSMVA